MRSGEKEEGGETDERAESDRHIWRRQGRKRKDQ